MTVPIQQAALRRWAKVPDEQRAKNTERARAVRDAQFAAAVDAAHPDLGPEERAERIAELRSSYYRALRQKGIEKQAVRRKAQLRRRTGGQAPRDAFLAQLAATLSAPED